MFLKDVGSHASETFAVLYPTLQFVAASLADVFRVNLYSIESILIIILISIIVGLIQVNSKIREYNFRVNNKDVRIGVAIGDIFEQAGDIFVPVNRQFEMNDDDHVMTGSIHSSFQEKYYKGRKAELEEKIAKLINKKQRRRDGGPGYSYGTVVKLDENSKKFYLVACNDIYNSRKQYAFPGKEVLNNYWDNMVRMQCTSKLLNIPLFGTGKAGHGLKQEEVAMLIVDSYVRFLMKNEFYVAKKLHVVINPDSVDDIDLPRLREYIEYRCKYPDR